MNGNSKASGFAKEIFLWWGIYVILGCCACFSLNIVFGLFGVDSLFDRVSLGLLAAFVGAVSLVLAFISRGISYMVKTFPEKRFRRRLDKILRENGICKEYTSLLSERLVGKTKNAALTELALAFILAGEPLQAKKYIEQINVLELIETARSTGEYLTAAYYYSVSGVIFLMLGSEEQAVSAFDSGKAFFEAINDDCFVAAAKAVRLSIAGRDDAALKLSEEADKMRRKTFKKGKRNDIQAFILGARANILAEAGEYSELAAVTGEALKIKVSDEFEKNMSGLCQKAEHKDTIGNNTAEMNNSSV